MMVIDMKDFSLDDIIKFAKKSTDDELKKEYYNAVYESLGSECEDMILMILLKEKSMKNI